MVQSLKLVRVQSLKLVRYLFILLILVSLTSVTEAVSFTEDTTPEFIFEQGEPDAALIITCEDTKGFVCESTYSCNLTVISPNSSVLINDQIATQQTNFFNFSLPETDTLGLHTYNVFCQNTSNAGASTELFYLVNLTGEELSVSKTILYIFILIVSLCFFLLCLFGAIKIPWNNKLDDEGFILEMNDLKYVKLFLWFMTYFFLLFITWLTASISKFLELGMASRFFDIFQSFLLIILLPVWLIVMATGLFKAFSEKNLNDMIGRNLRVR